MASVEASVQQLMLILYVFIDCKVKGIYFLTRSASWDCLARQSISIDVLYNRKFKSDDEVNISPEDKDVDVTIATDDHNKDFSFCHIRFLTDATNALRVSIIIIIHYHSSSSDKKMLQSEHTQNIS